MCKSVPFGPGPLRVSRAIHRLQASIVSPARAAVCLALNTHAYRTQAAHAASVPRLIKADRAPVCLDLGRVLATVPPPVLDPVSVELPPASKRMRQPVLSLDRLLIEALQAARA